MVPAKIQAYYTNQNNVYYTNTYKTTQPAHNLANEIITHDDLPPCPSLDKEKRPVMGA